MTRREWAAFACLTLYLSSLPAHAETSVLIGPGEQLFSASLPEEMHQPTKRQEVRNPSSLQDMLTNLPSLEVDGGTLVIEPDISGSTTILASKVTLRNGGKIVTHGFDLVINANEFTADKAEIIAFPLEEAIPPAAPGRAGRSGSSAGTVLLNFGDVGQLLELTVTLNGEHGQNGGPGLAGSMGIPGPPGEPDHGNFSPFGINCSRQASDGGAGGRGAPGGTGGRGGDGGKGGYLILQGAIAKRRLDIKFFASGGEPGVGGPGGPGGSGGPGWPRRWGGTLWRGVAVLDPAGQSVKMAPTARQDGQARMARSAPSSSRLFAKTHLVGRRNHLLNLLLQPARPCCCRVGRSERDSAASVTRG